VKLTIELVPSTSWFNNVRAVVSKKQWDYIKSQVASKAYYVCEICGGVGDKHPVECHEVWSYDNKTQTQKLERMIALCPDCHMVKHFGFAQVQGKGMRALHHLMEVNKLTRKKAQAYVEQAFETWKKRSEKTWKLDISHLSEYGIDISKIKEK